MGRSRVKILLASIPAPVAASRRLTTSKNRCLERDPASRSIWKSNRHGLKHERVLWAEHVFQTPEHLFQTAPRTAGLCIETREEVLNEGFSGLFGWSFFYRRGMINSRENTVLSRFSLAKHWHRVCNEIRFGPDLWVGDWSIGKLLNTRIKGYKGVK